MSSSNLTKIKHSGFRERFTEVCGSSQPSEIARLLDISYQAARNYLLGRLPDSNVLLTISEKTNYSIHWLLTGKGNKWIEYTENQDKKIFADQIRKFVREECLLVISEMFGEQTNTAPPKIVVISSEQIKEEKVREEKITSSFEER